MGNKGEDTGKMGVTSKKKTFFFFSKNVTIFKQKDRLLSKTMSFKYITQLSFGNKAIAWKGKKY